MNSNVFKIIDYILIIAIASLVFILANTYIRNQAIDGCARSYIFTQSVSEQNATVSYPMTQEYNKCLQEKGIK